MQFDMNLLVILTLNIGLVLAFACLRTRLLSYSHLINATQAEHDSLFSGLRVTFNVPRPVRRHRFPRIRVKSDSDDEPHMPF